MINVQKSPEWIAEYYKTIGASNAAVACGVSPWKTRSELGKVMLGMEEPEDLSDNLDVLRGALCEDAALYMLARELGCTLSPHNQTDFIYHDKYPHANVLPDAWQHQGRAEASIPCEVKCVRRATLARTKREQSPSDMRVLQCQHALAVTGAPFMHYGELNLEDMLLYYQRIERDEDLIKTVMDAEAEFYASIQRGEIPEDGPQLPYKAPSLDRKIITDPKALDLARQYLEVKGTKAASTDLLEELQAELESYIGDAQFWEFAGVLIGTHKEVSGRKTFDHKAAVKAYPSVDTYYREPDGSYEPTGVPPLGTFYKTGNSSMRFNADPVRK